MGKTRYKRYRNDLFFMFSYDFPNIFILNAQNIQHRYTKISFVSFIATCYIIDEFVLVFFVRSITLNLSINYTYY